MNARPLLALVLAALLFAPSLRAEDPILLRHHWEASKVYHFELNVDFEMSMPNAPGGGGSSSVILETDVTVRQATGTETKHAELKITSLKAMIDQAGTLITFDSANPLLTDPSIREGMDYLMGLGLTLVYDKDDAFKDVIVPKESALTPPPGGGPGPEVIAAFFREMVTGGLPGQPLVPGDMFAHGEDRRMSFAEVTLAKELNGRFDSIVDHEGCQQAKVVSQGTYQAAEQVQGPVLTFKGETLFDPERKTVTRSTIRTDVKYPQVAATMSVKLITVATLKSITDAPPDKK